MKRTGQNKIAVVGWGRGMGHKGHMYLADAVITQAQQMHADPYFFVSKTVGKDDPIFPEEKVKIYQKVFPQYATIFEPQGNLNQALQDLAGMGYQGVVVVVGADQKQAFQYLEKPNKEGVPVYQSMGLKKLRVISRQETNSKYANEEGPRATPMREVLLDTNASEEDKFKVWRRDMPEELGDREVLDIMNKAESRLVHDNAPKVLKPMDKKPATSKTVKSMSQKAAELKESRIMDRDAKINAFYVASNGNKHRVAENIPYYLLDKLVPLLTKKYAITMKDIEVRPADQSQYRRTNQPELAEEKYFSGKYEGTQRLAMGRVKNHRGQTGNLILYKHNGTNRMYNDPLAHDIELVVKDPGTGRIALSLYTGPDEQKGWELFNEYNISKTKRKQAQPELAEGVQCSPNEVAELLYNAKPEIFSRFGDDFVMDAITQACEQHTGSAQEVAVKVVDILKQGIDEGRKANTKAARKEFGARPRKENPAEQDAKKKESDEAWQRLMQYAADQKKENELEESPEEALKYATKAHAGQTRSGGDPYISHPVRVANHIKQFKQSHNLDALISAAYLHDTIEDTDTTQEILHDLFGGLVASLVKELTSDPEEIKKVGKAQYLSHKMAAMSSYGLVIKLADRLDNVKDITTARTPQWRAKYAAETNQILNYIEKTRALSGTHNKLIELIRAKLAEIDNPQQGVEEGSKYKCSCHPGDPDPDCPVHGLEPMEVGDALDVKKGVKEAGITRRGILKGIGAAAAAGAAGKAGAIAGAFPTPSHQAAMYKAAADSNAAQARADAAAKAKADAERLRTNSELVDKEQRVNHHKLDEFAPGNGDDGLPYAEYQVYQCNPEDQFDWIGGPLYQTDSMGMAHKYAYEKYVKHRPKAFMVWQERSQGSRGNYGVKGESDHDESELKEDSQVERKITRIQSMIQDFHNRAKATKNDIKKNHYLQMADQLSSQLDSLINDANEQERDGNMVAQHDAESSDTWNRGGLAEDYIDEK